MRYKSQMIQCAVVAQSVERFLGKEEVRQFKSAQQLQTKRDPNPGLVLFHFRSRLELVLLIRKRDSGISSSFNEEYFRMRHEFFNNTVFI